MAGLDPAIQGHKLCPLRLDPWMAASRAAMEYEISVKARLGYQESYVALPSSRHKII
jgi:hypothetical protein